MTYTLGQRMHDIKQGIHTTTDQEYSSQLSYAMRRIEQCQHSLIEYTRQVDKLRAFLLNEKNVEDNIAHNDATFNNLLRMPQIKSISFEDDTLIVLTHEIVVTYARTKYKLGEYRIAINFPGGELTITNLTRKMGDYDHPHVFCTSPCLGNIRMDVVKYMTTCEFGILIPLLINFLESVNAGEWYTHIDAWADESEEDSND